MSKRMRSIACVLRHPTDIVVVFLIGALDIFLHVAHWRTFALLQVQHVGLEEVDFLGRIVRIIAFAAVAKMARDGLHSHVVEVDLLLDVVAHILRHFGHVFLVRSAHVLQMEDIAQSAFVEGHFVDLHFALFGVPLLFLVAIRPFLRLLAANLAPIWRAMLDHFDFFAVAFASAFVACFARIHLVVGYQVVGQHDVHWIGTALKRVIRLRFVQSGYKRRVALCRHFASTVLQCVG
mmetsp:Transcript_41236/g.66328  ORF Transcript_41236/g.66328 Transcript_41236/m.66328 type:complete len:235 (+) Transcript_41236:745-1449(+)